MVLEGVALGSRDVEQRAVVQAGHLQGVVATYRCPLPRPGGAWGSGRDPAVRVCRPSRAAPNAQSDAADGREGESKTESDPEDAEDEVVAASTTQRSRRPAHVHNAASF